MFFNKFVNFLSSRKYIQYIISIAFISIVSLYLVLFGINVYNYAKSLYSNELAYRSASPNDIHFANTVVNKDNIEVYKLDDFIVSIDKSDVEDGKLYSFNVSENEMFLECINGKKLGVDSSFLTFEFGSNTISASYGGKTYNIKDSSLVYTTYKVGNGYKLVFNDADKSELHLDTDFYTLVDEDSYRISDYKRIELPLGSIVFASGLDRAIYDSKNEVILTKPDKAMILQYYSGNNVFMVLCSVITWLCMLFYLKVTTDKLIILTSRKNIVANGVGLLILIILCVLVLIFR